MCNDPLEALFGVVFRIDYNDTIHSTINVDDPDPACELPKLVTNDPREGQSVEVILNNSFGMLGINSVLILKKFHN